MKKFKKGDKVLLNENMRVRFIIGNDQYINKNLKKNKEVEIVKVEKADKKVGGCAYYIKANIDGKELFSSHTIANNKILPQELREMLEQARLGLRG